jgi:hypothetical protein
VLINLIVIKACGPLDVCCLVGREPNVYENFMASIFIVEAEQKRVTK